MELNNKNKKLGPETVVLNMESATDCSSKKLGLCQHCKICYAMKAERLYPPVLPYRRRQAQQWQAETVDVIAASVTRFKKAKYLRFSEAGDFKTQADVDKMSRISEKLKALKIKVYGYTARRDLDYSSVSDNMTVNGSGFTVHNQFKVVSERVPGALNCSGSCKTCGLCKTSKNRIINVVKH